MYLNINYINSKGLSAFEVAVLQIIKQQRTEELSDTLAMYLSDDMLIKFENEKLITQIKGKKSDNELSKLRLTKIGTELLENCETPEITLGDIDMANYLMDMYLSHEDEDRKIGNKKKTKIYCTQFRNHMNLTLHEMYWLCWIFLQEYPYTKVLEYIFFNSNKNRYGTFLGNIESSPLYQYLDENREKVQKIWKDRIK